MEEDINILENAIKCNKKQFEEIGVHILLQDDEMKAIENLINRVKELEEENKLLKELSLQDAETLKKQDEVLKIYKTNFIDKDKIKNILQKYRFCKVESLKEFYKEIEELLEEQEE